MIFTSAVATAWEYTVAFIGVFSKPWTVGNTAGYTDGRPQCPNAQVYFGVVSQWLFDFYDSLGLYCPSLYQPSSTTAPDVGQLLSTVINHHRTF